MRDFEHTPTPGISAATEDGLRAMTYTPTDLRRWVRADGRLVGDFASAYHGELEGTPDFEALCEAAFVDEVDDGTVFIMCRGR